MSLQGEHKMKIRFALVALAVLCGAALTAVPASAMPVAPLGSGASIVENVAVVCGARGCVRTAPVYRRGAVVVRRPYAARGAYYRRGYRRY